MICLLAKVFGSFHFSFLEMHQKQDGLNIPVHCKKKFLMQNIFKKQGDYPCFGGALAEVWKGKIS